MRQSGGGSIINMASVTAERPMDNIGVYGATKAAVVNLTQAYATLGSDAELAALKRMALLARRESLVMALGDVFFVLTIAFFLLVPLVFIMRRPRPFGSNAGH